MMFDDALSGLPVASQAAIQVALDAWASHPSCHRLCTNLRVETALPADAWATLLAAFAHRLGAGEPPEEAWTVACRAHQRRGAAHPAPPSVLARAMPETVYVDRLAEAAHVDRRRAVRVLELATARGTAPPPAVERLLRSAPLGRWLIWATFRADRSADRPFDGLPDDKDVIANALGLGEPWPPAVLLLLTYERPAGLVVHRPTVADAATYVWYAPHVSPSDPHRMTAPVDPASPPGFGLPEIVHREINGETLMFPVRRAV